VATKKEKVFRQDKLVYLFSFFFLCFKWLWIGFVDNKERERKGQRH
jgi:hypothetical protein